jgi:hypothetical protein
MQLLMFEEPGCVWCARWNEDVGGEYPITPEGQLAPLSRLQLRDPLPDNISLRRDRATRPPSSSCRTGQRSAGSKAIRERISSGACLVAFLNKKRPMGEHSATLTSLRPVWWPSGLAMLRCASRR